MAKKLTDEEKEANRKATNARNRAFLARRREYRVACDTVFESIAKLPCSQKAEEAMTEFDVLLKKRDDDVDELRRQILALEQQIKATTDEYSLKLDQVRDVRNAAQKEKQLAMSQLMAPVDEKYSDVVKRFSAAGWKPLSDFI